MEGTDFTPLRGFPRIYFTLPDTRTPHAGFGAVAVRWPTAVLWHFSFLSLRYSPIYLPHFGKLA
jgi:hypothetical protein